MFRSASCARHEGYEGNVSENDGPMVRLESDVRYTEFREENARRSRKMSVFKPSSFGLNSEF